MSNDITQTSPTHKGAAVDFLQRVAEGKVEEAFATHVGPRFRHHNPYFHGDAESLKTAMEQNATQHPQKVLDVQRAVEEGDCVAVHSRVRLQPNEQGMAIVHIFRFEDGQIAELWDVGQAVPENSPNEHGMF